MTGWLAVLTGGGPAIGVFSDELPPPQAARRRVSKSGKADEYAGSLLAQDFPVAAIDRPDGEMWDVRFMISA